jgi:lysozyme
VPNTEGVIFLKNYKFGKEIFTKYLRKVIWYQKTYGHLCVIFYFFYTLKIYRASLRYTKNVLLKQFTNTFHSSPIFIQMKVLTKGDKVEEVVILQRLLRKLNLVSVVDGDFGNKTDAAVRQFQKNNRLSPDGIMGEYSWGSLFEKAATGVLGTDIYHGDETKDAAFHNELEDKYWFCFAKSSQGISRVDPRFEEHMAKLKERTILRGGYHFFRLLNKDVQGEINNFLTTTKAGGIVWSEKGVLPPVLDIEPIGTEFGNPTKGKIIADRVNIAARAKKWLTTVEEKTGKTPIIYTTRLIWDDFLKAPKGFERYPLWVADYGGLAQPRMPSGWTNYMMWQFTDKGKIGGKVGFDVNKLNIPLGDLLKMAGY